MIGLILAAFFVYLAISIGVMALAAGWAKKRGRRPLPWRILAGLVMFLLFYAYMRSVPLPTDQAMIKHFQAHRADIEELVRRYRTFDPGPGKDHSILWKAQGDTPELIKRAGIAYISDTTMSYWLKDPYSPETARHVEELNKASRGFTLSQQYGVLCITLAASNRHRSPSLFHGVVWKDIYFFPEPPRIEGGYLLGPLNTKGGYKYKERVLSSLNFYPSNWKPYTSVFRPIEPQWFIHLDRSR
jgi:hypothetical protein